MEQLMLQYMLDRETGASAHPFMITPNELRESVPDWCHATGATCPNLNNLQNYLQQNGNWYRFAPGWLRHCSAVSRHIVFRSYIRVPGELDWTKDTDPISDEDLAFKIWERAKHEPEGEQLFYGVGSNLDMLTCLRRFLHPNRHGIQEFTTPTRLLVNMNAIERIGAETTELDTTIDPQRIAEKCLEMHGLYSGDLHLGSRIQRCLEWDQVLYRQSLPLWLSTLVQKARVSGEGESIPRILRLVERSRNQLVSDNYSLALRTVRTLVYKYAGILLADDNRQI